MSNPIGGLWSEAIQLFDELKVEVTKDGFAMGGNKKPCW